MEGSSNFLTLWVVVEWRFRNGKDHCNLIISILIWNVISSYIANREGLKRYKYKWPFSTQKNQWVWELLCAPGSCCNMIGSGAMG